MGPHGKQQLSNKKESSESAHPDKSSEERGTSRNHPIILIYIGKNMSRISDIHVTEHTESMHTATVIFFHGAGATGDQMRECINLIYKHFNFPHIKVVYPTVPLQPHISAAEIKRNALFHWKYVPPKVPEKLDSLEEMKDDVLKLIKDECDAGISPSRIVVGGYSMGGALALHTAYRWVRNVAGVFIFNSFLNENSVVYEDLKNPSSYLPPILQIHGDCDDVVDVTWAQDTYSKLRHSGVPGESHEFQDFDHCIHEYGMDIIKSWIINRLPDD